MNDNKHDPSQRETSSFFVIEQLISNATTADDDEDEDEDLDDDENLDDDKPGKINEGPNDESHQRDRETAHARHWAKQAGISIDGARTLDDIHNHVEGAALVKALKVTPHLITELIPDHGANGSS